MKASTKLLLTRLAHTAAWAFFAACVVLLPVVVFRGRLDLAAVLIAFVSFEILVLALNRGACPLTGIAARYTLDRRANFDIFLPLWLARYNKPLFGGLFLAGVIYTAWEWWRSLAEALPQP